MYVNDERIIILLQSLDLKNNISENEILREITNIVEHLINTDFPKLIDILYRQDVDEKKLKENIEREHPSNSAQIIARMLLERQKQKLALRRQFNASQNHISEDEMW